MEIDLDAIPVSPLAAKLCAAYHLDPLGTIASGALLATCAHDDADSLLQQWAQAGWTGTKIGRMSENDHHNPQRSTESSTGPNNGLITNPTTGHPQVLTALRAGKRLPFPTFAADEITKLWA
jgi:hydrogenase maturation factor